MISVRQLTKHYQVHRRESGLGNALRSLFNRTYTTVKAVDGISFDIKAGECIGFLGPNGAGKTTTLKVLAGLLHPSSGVVTVDGHTPARREEHFLKKITLVMGQKQQLLWDLPPRDTLELNRAIYDVPTSEFRARLDELVALLDVSKQLGQPTRQLSLGERMKCELLAALVHGPRLLFLDEPTIGLDVNMQVAVREFIRRYNASTGATVILTSHYMDDVAALCPRVIVIDKGQLAYDCALDQLVAKVRPGKRISLRLAAPVAREALAALGEVVELDQFHAVLRVEQAHVNTAVAQALSTLPVQDLTVENAPLEEVMGELFSGMRTPQEPPAA